MDCEGGFGEWFCVYLPASIHRVCAVRISTIQRFFDFFFVCEREINSQIDFIACLFRDWKTKDFEEMEIS